MCDFATCSGAYGFLRLNSSLCAALKDERPLSFPTVLALDHAERRALIERFCACISCPSPYNALIPLIPAGS
jgi:hypothetical protein